MLIGDGSEGEARDPLVGRFSGGIAHAHHRRHGGQEDEQASRLESFRPYQVNREMLAKAKSDTIVLHCLPAHREEEITNEVLEGDQCVAFDQAENKLHIHKAILAKHLVK